MIDMLCEEQGHIDISRSSKGGVKDIRRFVSALTVEGKRSNKTEFHMTEMLTIAERIGLAIPSFDEFVEKLNHQGFILKKGRNIWQIQSGTSSQA
mmetsp:Transcript_20991/g.51762  ORF Transcript_20991/g.51762 Transcript_20991/m.51762 type:complete len:95 (+) Transcript_20991:490-774(+)